MVNPEKSNAIIFTKRPVKHKPKQKIKLYSTAILWAKETKYLGVTLDQGLKFTIHVKNVTKKANQIRGYLYPLFNPRSKLNETNKISTL